MRVLLIGSGGREHALAWALARSPRLTRLFVAPGNPGTAPLATNVALDPGDFDALEAFCRSEAIDLVVVGPEAPLVAGLADRLATAGFRVFGPSREAARVEGSKDFTKKICDEAAIPTARYETVASLAEARASLGRRPGPIVVKYDGLMAGKGVTVAADSAEAMAALDAIYAGEPAARVVLEECLLGEEASFFCLVDGETVVPFGSAQDHKRAFDGDEGPNTGGMGAYSPAPALTPALEAQVLNDIVRPTARVLAQRGTPYRGVLFVGLMLTAEGPKLIEYNCRFGDPECQVLMLRLADDLLPILDGVASGRLRDVSVRLSEQAALGVVMASRGYPGAYDKGSAIHGLDAAGAVPGARVCHAGTAGEPGAIRAAGGRVLTVCATGDTLRQAREAAYSAVDRIDWPEGFCRRDIGRRGLEHEERAAREKDGR